ncbi:MAG: hypothetical protein FD129_1559, partial [bacterium]
MSAPGVSVGEGIPRPRIYVFERSGNNWGIQTRIEPTGLDGFGNHRWGESIAMVGNVLAVTIGPLNRVHLIRRVSTLNWAYFAELRAPDGGAFGYDVAMQGDRLAVAASYRLFTYLRQGNGNWTLEQQVDVYPGAGSRVALSDRALVS